MHVSMRASEREEGKEKQRGLRVLLLCCGWIICECYVFRVLNVMYRMCYVMCGGVNQQV